MVFRRRSRNCVPAADNVSNQQIGCKRTSRFTDFSHYMPLGSGSCLVPISRLWTLTSHRVHTTLLIALRKARTSRQNFLFVVCFRCTRVSVLNKLAR